jgi:hypothetical protein
LSQNKALSTRGKDLGEGIFTPYGFYQLEVTIGGVPASFVSRPIEVTMNIPTSIKRGLNNSDAPTAIQSGNNIDFWSFDESTHQWRNEGNSRVTTVGGNLQYKFQQSHLSFWAVADRRSERACSNPGFQANYTPTPTANAASRPCFYTKVRSAHNPHHTLGSFYSDYATNPFVDLRRIMRRTNQRVILDIYDSQGGRLLHQVTNVIPCNRPTVQLAPLRIARQNGNYFNFKIDLRFTCPNAPTSFGPTASIYAAEVTPSGALRYRYIGTMQNGIMNTCLLRRGVPYVFKVARGPLSATSIDLGHPSITFPADRSIRSCTLPFTNAAWGLNDYPVTATATDADPDTYVFSLPNFQAPADLCNKWFQYF